jgi:predicted Zn-dependent protease
MRHLSKFRAPALTGLALLASVAIAGCRTENLGAYTQAIENQNAPASMLDQKGVGQEFRLTDLQPNQRPMNNSDEASIWLLMERVEAQLKTAGNRLKDEKLNAYIRDVTCRVTGPHCKDVRSYTLRIPAFNATMYANGMTTVWTGLLLRVRNEAQLAAVIGHEAGHFLRRHSLQRMRNLIDQTNTFMFIQFALAGAGAGAMNNILALAVSGNIAAFGRDNEREADGYGILLASKAGYDPREAAKIWQQLERERKADKDHSRSFSFLSSHPTSEERAQALTVLGKKFIAPRMEIGRERFLEAVLPIRAKLLRDELHLRQFDKFSTLLDIMMEDGANMAELHYFKGELHRLRQNEGDAKIALASYRAAKAAQGTAPADIDRSMALAYRQLGQADDSRAALQRYLTANPKAKDAAMIRQMLKRK